MVNLHSSFPLLQLPDPCLVAVLRCCDPRSMCSAARAHSRLHQAVFMALSSIKATRLTHEQLDDLMNVYIPSHGLGQRIDSISLGSGLHPTLRQLPSGLTRLTTLDLECLDIQLLPGSGCQGVLGAATAPLLKQPRLHYCRLLDEEGGLAAALDLLPALDHLSIGCWSDERGERLLLSGNMLLKVQQLTYLEVDVTPDIWSLHDVELFPDLKHLSALTRLADLQLTISGEYSITASMLAGSQHLTRLVLHSFGEHVCLDPAILAGKTRLQHLELGCSQLERSWRPLGGAGVLQLLSHLQQQQQLTYLVVGSSLRGEEGNPPAAAYAALTASSKLQHLDISSCHLPPDVWQHIFPAGRQLPLLRVLNIQRVKHLGAAPAAAPLAAPDGTCLVSCCPSLQCLNIRGLQYSQGLLASLQGLSSLRSLQLEAGPGSAEGVEGVCQLTGLEELLVCQPLDDLERLLPQLAQLRQLTSLRCEGSRGGFLDTTWTFSTESPGEAPVWRQVLQLYLNHSEPTVAQAAAAVLAQDSPSEPCGGAGC